MAVKYRFSGHQTFPFRYSWLTKGVRALDADPGVFFCDDAIVTLGVGKNMVASIRFWCEALKLAVVDGRAHKGGPTILGTRLLGKGGWDPYLEDPGTLWLLHWLLVEREDIASTWYLTFTQWTRETFTRPEMLGWVQQVAEEAADARTSTSSLRRDVDVFIRTYVPSRIDNRRAMEEAFDCPLVELRLIGELDGGIYHFSRGPKPTLPTEVFAYALSRFWNREAREQETLSFERLMYGPGSPGAAFKLTESAMAKKLEALAAWSGVRYDETGGLRLLIKRNLAEPLEPMDCLDRYYQGRAKEAAA